MRCILWLFLWWSFTLELSAQSFQVGALKEVYKGYIGEMVNVPVRLTNPSDKPVTLVIRKVNESLGGTQKSYFCQDKNCLGQEIEDYVVRLEPGQELSDFFIVLDAGLANGVSSAKYLVFNRYNHGETTELNLNFAIEERLGQEDVFSNGHIILHEVYPNPIRDVAFINYDMLTDDVQAKIVIHNILGNAIDEYSLPASENKVKIRTESMNAGIYFYTLYLDNEGVVTRKVIVKK